MGEELENRQSHEGVGPCLYEPSYDKILQPISIVVVPRCRQSWPLGSKFVSLAALRRADILGLRFQHLYSLVYVLVLSGCGLPSQHSATNAVAKLAATKIA